MQLKKTRYLVHVFFKLSRIMNYKSLVIIYYGLFYGVTAWGAADDNAIKISFKLREKTSKIIDEKRKGINTRLCR